MAADIIITALANSIKADSDSISIDFGTQSVPLTSGKIVLNNVRVPAPASPTETLFNFRNPNISGYRLNHYTNNVVPLGEFKFQSFVNNTIEDLYRIYGTTLELTTLDIDLNGNKIVNSADPVSPQDLVTLAYFDANSGGGGGIIDPMHGGTGIANPNINTMTVGGVFKTTDEFQANGVFYTGGSVVINGGFSTSALDGSSTLYNLDFRLIGDSSLTLPTFGVVATLQNRLDQFASPTSLITLADVNITGNVTADLHVLGDVFVGDAIQATGNITGSSITANSPTAFSTFGYVYIFKLNTLGGDIIATTFNSDSSTLREVDITGVLTTDASFPAQIATLNSSVKAIFVDIEVTGDMKLTGQLISNLNFNGTHKIINLADGIDDTDGVNVGQMNAAIAAGGGGGGVTTLTGAVTGTAIGATIDTTLNTLINRSTLAGQEFSFNNTGILDNDFILRNSYLPSNPSDKVAVNLKFLNQYQHGFYISHLSDNTETSTDGRTQLIFSLFQGHGLSTQTPFLAIKPGSFAGTDYICEFQNTTVFADKPGAHAYIQSNNTSILLDATPVVVNNFMVADYLNYWTFLDGVFTYTGISNARFNVFVTFCYTRLGQPSTDVSKMVLLRNNTIVTGSFATLVSTTVNGNNVLTTSFNASVSLSPNDTLATAVYSINNNSYSIVIIDAFINITQ